MMGICISILVLGIILILLAEIWLRICVKCGPIS